ncbi:MAG: Glucokinase, partial [Pseudomonadota bacterium]
MKTGARYLLADIGGTFARFAVKRQGGAPAHHRQYRTAEHQSLAA